MRRLILHYEAPDDLSIPKLKVIEGKLTNNEQNKLQEEIAQRYSSLCFPTDRNSLCSFKTPLSSIGLERPQFRIEVDRSAGRRNPPIRLELETIPVVQSPVETRTPDAPPTWCHLFFDELEHLLGEQTSPEINNSFERANLKTAIEELKRVLTMKNERSGVIALFLLGGYLELASRICDETDKNRGSCYRLAGRPIEELFSSLVFDQATAFGSQKSIMSETNHSVMPRSSKISRFLRERLFPSGSRDAEIDLDGLPPS